MNLELSKAFGLAIDNITKFGDTDVFPFPIENPITYDKRSDVLKLLNDMHKNFENYIKNTPPQFENMLAPCGYTGFRWATQIDPIWNAYLLGLVLFLSDKIEDARISKDKNCIFSYRIQTNLQEKTLFDTKYGWHKFHEVSLDLASRPKYGFVLICDISNFYQSVYHHRVENALSKLDNPAKEVEKNIMNILQQFSNMKSYGLPIGGQASRILAELVLNRTDRLLRSKQIRFCRFVDDYHIFAKTEEELYSSLLYLSKILIENEGFSLQKSKTRIISTDEFIKTSPINENESENNKNIFAISLKYDPYSMTADEDYEKLKKEIADLDILKVLSQELNKSRIHTSLMKKIIRTLQYLEYPALISAVQVLIDNIEMLAPVFPNLMILLDSIFERLPDDKRNKILNVLHELVNNSSYILKIDLNVAYALRVLSKVCSDENEIIILKLWEQTNSPLIKRDIILIMAKWNATYWISDLKNRYTSLTSWEKRSFIIASYKLGDEGTHWRKHFKDQFSEIDLLYRDWMSEKNQQPSWRLPICLVKRHLLRITLDFGIPYSHYIRLI